MIRKLLTGLLFFVALSLASFQAGSTEQEKIRIGVDPSYPPFSEVDEAGKLKGFDIEIAQALCDKLNVECEFFQIKWNELIQQLRAGTFDAIVSSMSITEKRRESVAFTERYYSNLVQFVVHKDSNFDPNGLTGHTIGVAPGTVSSIWLEDNVADIATIKHFTEADSIFEALKNGEVDAIFGDGLGYWHWLQGPDGADFKFAGDGFSIDEGIGIAVRKNEQQLLDNLNHAISAILSDGTYKSINDRFFPFSIY